MEKEIITKNLNELNVVVTNYDNKELLNEHGTTLVSILLQDNGKIVTNFLGSYNDEILKTLEIVIKQYFKKGIIWYTKINEISLYDKSEI